MHRVRELPGKAAGAIGRLGKRAVRYATLAAAAGFILLVFDVMLLGRTRRDGTDRG